MIVRFSTRSEPKICVHGFIESMDRFRERGDFIPPFTILIDGKEIVVDFDGDVVPRETVLHVTCQMVGLTRV